MGAFLLFDRKLPVQEEVLRKLFVWKGFPEPHVHEVGEAVLWLFPKQVNPKQNSIVEDDGRGIFAVGTPVYRGLGYHATLEALKGDIHRRQVSWDDLRGTFALLHSDNGANKLVLDGSGLLTVYARRDGRILSTSLEAVLVADGERHPLERESLLEQLLVGYVVGSSTLFKDVVSIGSTIPKDFVSPLVRISTVTRTECAETTGGFDAQVGNQLEILREHMRGIRCLAQEEGVALGLSGGYDSRLLLLLALDANLPVQTYTFQSMAHKQESARALDLATCCGVACEPTPVRRWEELENQEFRNRVEDALGYYDGRTNASMGTLNDVHSRGFRRLSLLGQGLSLNGMGGELYRNHNAFPDGKLRFNEWAISFVLASEGLRALEGRRLVRNALFDRLRASFDAATGTRMETVDRHLDRLWYRKVWLPCAAAPKFSAENQVSLALMPFADAWVTAQSLPHLTRWLGIAGRFEAAMIAEMHPGAASMPSNYGHGFDRIPPAVYLKWRLISLARLRARSIWAASCVRHDPSPPVELRERSPIRDAICVLQDANTGVDLEVLTSTRAGLDRVLYVGAFLKEFSGNIRF